MASWYLNALPPAFITCASVVFRKTVRVALTLLVALDDLEVMTADIKNAYLTAPLAQRYGVFMVLNLVLMLGSKL